MKEMKNGTIRQNNINEIEAFRNYFKKVWERIPWMPKETKVTITYPTPGSIPKERSLNNNHSEDKDLLQWAFEKYWEKYTGKGN